jgi:ADP-ribose pyrophosphatase
VGESTSVCPRTHNEHQFYFIETADWVNIVPVTRSGEVVFIRQFRHGSEKITLEIPGGMIDPGEAAQVAATRECLEETGYEASRVESLGVLNPNPAIFPNRLHTFIARDCQLVGDIENTSTEHTEVELIPMTEIASRMQSGDIDHALVVATLWRMLYFESNRQT